MKVLQTFALPLGYGAEIAVEIAPARSERQGSALVISRSTVVA